MMTLASCPSTSSSRSLRRGINAVTLMFREHRESQELLGDPRSPEKAVRGRSQGCQDSRGSQGQQHCLSPAKTAGCGGLALLGAFCASGA